MPGEFQVGSYYFPNYHVDPRNERVHGPGWTEWRLVEYATPRFAGHDQPRRPLWGFLDEADPQVMARKIDAAADHGIDYFIFDWYWYDDGPFLQRCLEDGYLRAANNSRVKFCCMWANHDWHNIHPASRCGPQELMARGIVGPQAWEAMTDHLVGTYFVHPSHFCIDGRPYFSVYELGTLVASFGSPDATRRALDAFRAKAVAAGLPGLHLNAVIWGQAILPGESKPADPLQIAQALGFDSITGYVWMHHIEPARQPRTPYADVQQAYFEHWEHINRRCQLPYYPNVTMGWDASPRTVQSDLWEPIGYPYMTMLDGNTPKAFGAALQATRDRLEQLGGPKILNINCWNEWTEGSYLEPDTVHGMAYLDAVKDVFGTR